MGEVATRSEGELPLPPAPQLPDGKPLEPVIIDPPEPLLVFTGLVTGNADIVGLVAYSIHKQLKHDWLKAYARDQGRMPNATEAQSYLLGESTPRRLATYRHLAQAVLDGSGPDMPDIVPAASLRQAQPVRIAAHALPPRIGIAQGRSNVQLSSRALVGLAITFVVLLTLLWLVRSSASAAPLLSLGTGG